MSEYLFSDWTPINNQQCWIAKKDTYRTQWFKGEISFRTKQSFIIRHVGGNEFNATVGDYMFFPTDSVTPDERPKKQINNSKSV